MGTLEPRLIPFVARGSIAADNTVPELVHQLTASVCGSAVSERDPAFRDYSRRLRTCLEYHAARTPRASLSQIIARLRRGEIGGRVLGQDVLQEVVLAEALLRGEARAAEHFEREYMPIVRSAARRLGGPRAEQEFENFAADLVLPRDHGPPRLATFAGHTTLAPWLIAVVSNLWRAGARRKRTESLTEPTAPASYDDVACSLDRRSCEGLLVPIFVAASRALDAADRLLLKMLLLDGVPQNAMARSLGLNSGTLTRRRQQAAATLLQRVRQLALACSRPHQARECMALLLTDGDAELSRRLGTILAEGIGSVPPACEGGGT